METSSLSSPSLKETQQSLEQSLRSLKPENLHRKSFLRLSEKSTTPKRISLHQGYQVRKDGADDSRMSDFSPNVSNAQMMVSKFLKKEYDGAAADISLTLQTSDLRAVLAQAGKHDLSLREMMTDSASTGVILKTAAPWREVNLRLFHEFLESMQARASEPAIFDTIADFIQNCSDTLDIIRGMQSKVENPQVSEEELGLENERNTWRLIYCLYRNRLTSNDYRSEMETEGSVCVSEKTVIEYLYSNESLIREYQLIADWLEKNALDQGYGSPTIEHFTDKTIAWENTLHQLQNHRTGISFGSSRPIVSSLDPDAPIREGKPLHDLDKEDDARLEKRMFFEVRSGRLRKAQALAIHCGQPWRAACLLGWIPHHDPNYRNPLTDVKLPIEGNPNRGLWKLCAWELSRDKRIGQYYRAIYASLCGNVQQLLTISQSWEDALWAYVKTILDIKVESELRGSMPKDYTKMPEEYWNNDMSLESIFNELHCSKEDVVRKESNEPAHLIQKYLILDDIPKLMLQIEQILNESDLQDPQFLRFLAHLILFLKQIGKNINEEIGNHVLLAYVRVLMEFGDPILVAYYTATLPHEEQVTNYASYLENVRDYEARKKCLVAAEEANLNVEAITKLVVENIRKKDDGLESADLQGKITDADTEKIEALDWLTFYQSQREEALWQTNALIRFFLSSEKLDAARKAFNKIPEDSIELVMSQYPQLEATMGNITHVNVTISNNLSKKASAAIREFLCYKTYLDAQEGFAEWFSHFHHGKPTPLEELPSYATFTEKVAYDHKKSQYNTELDRWKCTMQHHTKAVKQLLFNVLLFPDGGWLDSNVPKDEETSSPEEILREHQLEKLRKLCIPKTALLLLSVMSEMNEHAECIQFADILASEKHQLYKEFPKGKLREVYKKICESSLVLMDQKKDPWGYSK